MKNEQLTMKNQKAPTRKYPSYKDSGIQWLGEVPAHWEVRRAKDISQIFVPQRDKPELKDEDGIPWVTTELLGGKVLDMNKVNYFVSDEEVKAKKIRKVPVNSVLVTCVGEFSLTAINKFPVIINQQIQAYSYLKKTYPEFVSYQIQAKVSKDYFEKSSTETTLKYLNKEKFSLLVIYLPPLSEQIAIANYLDTHTAKIDKKVELLTKKATLYANLKQSLINETVTRGLNKKVRKKDSGIEWIGEIPEHWDVKRVAEISAQQKVKNDGMKETNLLSLSYGKIVRKDINTSFGLLPESFETYQIVYKNNLILRLTDMQNDHKSLRSALVMEKGIITTAYLCLQFSHKVVNPIYGYYIFHNYDITKALYMSGGGLRQTMKYDDVKLFPFPLPPLHEQAAIADYLDNKTKSIDRIIEKIHLQIDKLKELRKALVNDVVTGKIRVADNG